METTRDRELLRAYLSQDPALHLYELGDLDPVFFERTRWYVSHHAGSIEALCLLYGDVRAPVLIALASKASLQRTGDLVEALAPTLPAGCYAHMSPAIADRVRFRPDRAEYHRMALSSEELAALGPARVDTCACGDRDAEALRALYDEAHTDHWFDPAMLATGTYRGIVGDERPWDAAGGVHVVSRKEGVAALGNIATHPNARRKGFGRAITNEVCRHLPREVHLVGLNVAARNHAAIACYRSLGFAHVADYIEGTLA